MLTTKHDDGTTMDALLMDVLDAHGGLEEWRESHRAHGEAVARRPVLGAAGLARGLHRSDGHA